MATEEVNQRELVIEWKIKNFFSLSQKLSKSYISTHFPFLDASWCLEILPNGERGESEGYIGLFLHRVQSESSPAISLNFSLGLKTFDEKIYAENYFSHDYEKIRGHGIYDFLRRSELLEKRMELVPSGVLSIVCRIKHPNLLETTSLDNSVTTKCEYCKINLEAHEDISSHQQKCMDKPIKCPECSDVIALRNWYDHKCQVTEKEDHEKVLSDLREMLLSGEHSDTTIMVKGETFRLHKNILAFRSPYFHAMFKNDMKEKITGVVSIDDCEPDIFRTLVHFLYTGNVDKLTSENVCGLYEAANKYQEDQLKKKCLQFMVSMMSVENFCDFTVIALRHDDKTLLQDATRFFANKTKDIIRSVKWQNFLLDYPIQANELHIKALDFSDDKRI